MASLQNKTISETYPGLLHISNDSSDAQSLDGTLRVIEDGTGTDSILSLSTDGVQLGAVVFDATGVRGDLIVDDDLTVNDDCSIGDNLTVGGNVLVVDDDTNRVGVNTTSPSHDLHITGNIGLSGNILNANDTDNIIATGTDLWQINTGGSRRVLIQSASAPPSFETHDVNFIATSSDATSPYPLYTVDSSGFLGIGNQTSPANLVHMKIQGANVGEDKDNDAFTPEDADWMKNTFLAMENTFSSDGSTDPGGDGETFMTNVSTGLKFRQKVYGASDVFTQGLIEFSPRVTSVTSTQSTWQSKMDIWLASHTRTVKFKHALRLSAYSYDIDNTGSGEGYATNHEMVLNVGTTTNRYYAGYISTLGAYEDHDSFDHPMHYTNIDTAGSDMGVGYTNLCESLNLIKTHVMRKSGSIAVAAQQGYAAGICMQPGYSLLSPCTAWTIVNHNYISILPAVLGSSVTLTGSNLINFDFDLSGTDDTGSVGPGGSSNKTCIRNNTNIGSHAGSIFITIGDDGSQTRYLIPFYALS